MILLEYNKHRQVWTNEANKQGEADVFPNCPDRQQIPLKSKTNNVWISHYFQASPLSVVLIPKRSVPTDDLIKTDKKYTVTCLRR